MAGLQRSSISFRRQGSSGLVWDDKILNGEINLQREKQAAEEGGGGGEESAKKSRQEIEVEKIVEKKSDLETGSATTIEIKRSRSDGGRGIRAGKVSPAIEPPSPKVSVCGFCSGFAKTQKTRRR
ncbi:hypothetical protein M569_11660, partial [Genlisea aurea]